MTAFGYEQACTLADMRREICRRSFSRYARYMWPVLQPDTPLEWGWPHEVVCDHLQAVTEDRIQNLLINIPPRFLKSSLTSVLWPSWEWLRKPSLSYLTGSYDGDLAMRDAVAARRIMRSPEYRALLPADGQWHFAGDQDVKSRYENNRGGERIAISVGSKLLGFGGERIIIDDAHNADDATNPDALKRVHDWHDQGLITRANDYRTVKRVYIMQRIGPDDLSGHILAAGNVEYLCLPLVYDPAHPYAGHKTSIGFSDPRTTPGEALMPDRYPQHVIDQLRQLMRNGWNGQMQQHPVPDGGTIFQRDWFKFWTSVPHDLDVDLISVDCAFKGNTKEELERVRELSFVVFDRWGFKGERAYLIDQDRGQWDFSTTVERFIRFVQKHSADDAPVRAMAPTDRKLIEAKANGIALTNLLQNAIPGLEEVEPNGSKIERAYAVQDYVKGGAVYVPDPSIAPWVTRAMRSDDLSWLDEVTQFPFAPKKRNDRVDTCTMALQHSRVFKATSVIERLKALGSW